MSPRFVLGRENVRCVAEVVNRSLKADCTDFNNDCSNSLDKSTISLNVSPDIINSLFINAIVIHNVGI